MKTLGLSFVIALISSIVAYQLLIILDIPKDVAENIPPLLWGGVPFINSILLREQQKEKRNVPLDITGYGVNPLILGIYSYFLCIGVAGITGTASGLLTALAGVELQSAGFVLTFLAIFFAFPCFFFIGRWVGYRSISHGIVVIILSVALARVTIALVDYMFLPSSAFQIMLDEQKTLLIIGWHALIGGVAIACASLFGYWRGRKIRLEKYVSYLLNSVDRNTRQTIIDIAFEEARIASEKQPNQKIQPTSSVGG